ncbi:MAG: glycerol-3-phosphate 1-O-acyltransferase PlsY [Lachnospiraceae bacterium]|nr:glycerol-3-phosphate 1-O-acyltransferase PlsY [Lachnospiraceae bacterium]
MIRLVCLLIGYAFGLFQTAYLYGKMHGIDIRTMGSGNAGTTNTLRVLGAKAGAIVLLGDMIKTILAIVIVRLLVVPNVPELKYLLILYTAAGAILGHNYPFYLGFKGGKGIAATAGLIAAFHPLFIPVGLILFIVAFVLTHYVSLGSLLVYAGFVIQLVVMGQLGAFGEMEQAALNEMYLIGFLLLLMAYWKHKDNIKRLLTGTERKTYLSKKEKAEEK